MTRTITGLCAAAAFGMVASLGAQTTGTTDQSQRSHAAMSSRNAEMTITGCLQKGADGNYILTNARTDNGSMAGSTTGAGATTTAGTTGSTTGSTAGTTASSGTTGSTSGTSSTMSGRNSSSSMESATTWELTGGKDLDKHVGHRIQVTGRALGSSEGGNEEHASATGTTGGAVTGSTATGSTAGTTASTAGTTGSTSGTAGTMTGTTAGAMTGTTGESQQRGSSTGSTSSSSTHRLDVKSVKMVSTSCS